MTPEKNSTKSPDKNEHVKEAQEQAEKDIEKDPDLKIEESKADDLDEGELARLEGHP
jgi:hypothetical protein